MSITGPKQCRRLATRYDRLAANELASVQLASIRLWLRRGLVRRHGFCQTVAECLRYAVIAPVILVQPISVEIAEHLIKGDTTIDVPVAHDFKTTEQSDIVFRRNHIDDTEHLLGRGGRRLLGRGQRVRIEGS